MSKDNSTIESLLNSFAAEIDRAARLIRDKRTPARPSSRRHRHCRLSCMASRSIAASISSSRQKTNSFSVGPGMPRDLVISSSSRRISAFVRLTRAISELYREIESPPEGKAINVTFYGRNVSTNHEELARDLAQHIKGLK